MDDEVITQLGLLLTQMRYTRMALENVERSTARYAGLALTAPAATGTGAVAVFGAPPMLDGALKVYVVNLHELASGGGGPGNPLAGLIGGAGRFAGGLAGGFAGGVIGGVTLPYLLFKTAQIAGTVERIVNRLGVRGAPRSPEKNNPGPGVLEQLDALLKVLRELRAVVDLTARPRAGGGSGGGGGTEDDNPPAPVPGGPAELYLRMVQALTRMVDGLILLVPILTGALASLLIRLDDIKLVIVDLLRFGLRNVLLLRAAVIATVLDTVSLAARLAVTVVGIVAAAVDTVLASVLAVIRTALETALTAVRIASTGVKNTVDALMLFLRDGVGALLIFIGNLRVFRLIVHLAQVLPLVLPAIARIKGVELDRRETEALTRAGTLMPPGAPAAGASPPAAIAAFPDLAEKLLPEDARRELVDQVGELGATLRRETGIALGAVSRGVSGLAAAARETADNLDTDLGRRLADRLGEARKHAVSLADSLRAAEEVARRRPETGLEVIAAAYEGWLRGGGLAGLLEKITAHFERTPVSAADPAAGARTIPGRVVTGTAVTPAGAEVVVEIGELVVDLAPAAAPERPGPAGPAGAAFDPEAYQDWRRDLRDRGALALKEG
ncbi:hypothetical protein GCM10010156_40830 [Planobispora rosea]|uniref:Uncharacterized protein n=1 Tax=Planobispora rosea TaxID=35762 RepID=A0A8J3WD56_PLARO|nr:hypothetical protein [Planobispora rosea]GGS77863.1 hypothetical protein GCM10010156_40830 [Planobispora rosea]GIH85609.1 hypothetical protein Pro02_40170 [Planobispora rosea]